MGVYVDVEVFVKLCVVVVDVGVVLCEDMVFVKKDVILVEVDFIEFWKVLC